MACFASTVHFYLEYLVVIPIAFVESQAFQLIENVGGENDFKESLALIRQSRRQTDAKRSSTHIAANERAIGAGVGDDQYLTHVSK